MNKITVKHPDGRPATQEELERIAGIPTLLERAEAYWQTQRRVTFPDLMADFAGAETERLKREIADLTERCAKQEEQIAKIGERREALESERDQLWKLAADRHDEIRKLTGRLTKLHDSFNEVVRQRDSWIKLADDRGVEAMKKESGQGIPQTNPFGAYCNRVGALYLKVPNCEHGISLHQATLLRRKLLEAIETAAAVMSGEVKP